MNRLTFLVGATTLLIQKEYSFSEIPNDGKAYNLKTGDKRLKCQVICYPLISCIGEYVNEGVDSTKPSKTHNSIGTSRVGICARRTESPLGVSRDVMIYMEVSPLTEEFRLGSMLFRIYEVNNLISKFHECLRISSNIKLLNDLASNPRISIGDLEVSIRLNPAIGIDKIDETFKEYYDKNPELKSPYIENTIDFSMKNKTKKITVRGISDKDLKKIVSDLTKALKWLESYH